MLLSRYLIFNLRNNNNVQFKYLHSVCINDSQRCYIAVIFCNVKFNISTYKYCGDVVGTVNIPNCEVVECDVAKQCSMFCHTVTSICNRIKKHETSQFQRTDFAFSAQSEVRKKMKKMIYSC